MEKIETIDTAARPFLKWAGGKTQLIDTIDARLPTAIQKTGTIEKYVEPFVGGGAVFFHLQEQYNIQESYLYDINRELIVGYQAIKENHSEVIEHLQNIEKDYLSKSKARRKKFYYSVRDEYNSQIDTFNYENYNPNWSYRAALLIFLNKTCFNGLFRQNQKGEFNVPHGRYVNPTICDSENIEAVHRALQSTKLICGDFTLAGNQIDEDTFVYFDPPYRPLNKTSSFTSYFKGDFTDTEQQLLGEFYHKMNKRGAKLLLSNSDPKNENPGDDFFDKLYQGNSITIERVPAKRSINSDGAGRGEINELLIYNYKVG